MSKNLSVQYYQVSKERIPKMIVKVIKIFLNNKKEKSTNMVVKYTKIPQKMTNKGLLSIEKNITE